jgi:glutamate carboxypeptidase
VKTHAVVRIDDLRRDQDEMLSLLADLVTQDTPVDNKKTLDALLGHLEGLLRASGAVTEVVSRATTGNILRAEWKSPASGTANGDDILLLGHLDTVWPMGEVERRPFEVMGDRATGPGVLDMKAGLVILVFGMRALSALGRLPTRRVVALINCDEEVGSLDSRDAIEDAARESSAVLVLEPAMPDGSLKTARKGSGRFTLACRGRAAHAGAFPELGISAIEELARQTTYLHNLTDFGLGTTVNVGVIRGGTRPNVVAAEAEGMIDVRAVTVAEMERLERSLRNLEPALEGAVIEMTGGWERPPMERLPGNVALFKRAQSAARALGFEVGEASSGAASDGNFATALGIATLDGLGAVGEGPHAKEEFIEVASLVERSALLASLVSALDVG